MLELDGHGLRLVGRPGDVGRASGERAEPALEATVGEQADAEQAEQQQHAPRDDGGAVDGQRALDRRGAPADDGPVDGAEVEVDADGLRERRDDATGGEQRLQDEASAARREGLDEHADDGDAAEDQQRRDERPLDGGRGDLGLGGDQGRGEHHSPPSSGADGPLASSLTQNDGGSSAASSSQDVCTTSVRGGGSDCPTLVRVSSTAGLMTSSSGWG